jgi:hypothetical protein
MRPQYSLSSLAEISPKFVCTQWKFDVFKKRNRKTRKNNAWSWAEKDIDERRGRGSLDSCKT